MRQAEALRQVETLAAERAEVEARMSEAVRMAVTVGATKAATAEAAGVSRPTLDARYFKKAKR